MAITQQRLLELAGAELDELYRHSPAGPIPRGVASGQALAGIGSARLSRAAAAVVSVGWRGKVFDAGGGRLANRISPLAFEAVRADVYPGHSLFDGGEAIVIDYSRTSLLARSVRDELREVAPGLYLGLAYWRGRKVLRFSLRFVPELAARSTVPTRG